jgi:O-6-methylguanine DNA methyltransferase
MRFELSERVSALHLLGVLVRLCPNCPFPAGDLRDIDGRHAPGTGAGSETGISRKESSVQRLRPRGNWGSDRPGHRDAQDQRELASRSGGNTISTKRLARIASHPLGQSATYSEIASRIGAPNAAPAVSVACLANRIALVVPCHRAVDDGDLGDYRWGLERKRMLLGREPGTRRFDQTSRQLGRDYVRLERLWNGCLWREAAVQTRAASRLPTGNGKNTIQSPIRMRSSPWRLIDRNICLVGDLDPALRFQTHQVSELPRRHGFGFGPLI